MKFGEALEHFKQGKRIKCEAVDRVYSFVLKDGIPFLYDETVFHAYYEDGDEYTECDKYRYSFDILDLLRDDWEVVE